MNQWFLFMFMLLLTLFSEAESSCLREPGILELSFEQEIVWCCLYDADQQAHISMQLQRTIQTKVDFIYGDFTEVGVYQCEDVNGKSFPWCQHNPISLTKKNYVSVNLATNDGQTWNAIAGLVCQELLGCKVSISNLTFS